MTATRQPTQSNTLGWFSIADHAPTADGTTSDNPAWAAVYAACIAAGGGVIYIPRLSSAGYRLSVCQVTHDDITIEIEPGVKIQYAPYASTDPVIFKLGDSTSSHYNRVYIHCSGQFTIDGTDQTGVSGSSVMRGVSYFNIRDGGVEGMTTNALAGTAPNSILCAMNSSNSSPYRATFKRIHNTGVIWKGGSTVQISGGFDITCEDHHSDSGATVRVETDGNAGAIVDGVYARDCSTNGDGGNPNTLWMLAAHANTIRNVHFEGGRATGLAHLLQISYDAANPNPVQACSMSKARVTGGGQAICYSQTTDQHPLDMTFRDVTCEGALTSGPVFPTGAGFEVSGGRFYDCHARYCQAGGFIPVVNPLADAVRSDFYGCTATGNNAYGWLVDDTAGYYLHSCSGDQPGGNPPNFLDAQTSGMETASVTTGWTILQNDTFTQSTTIAHTGSGSLKHVSTSNGLIGTRTTTKYPVTVGTTYFGEYYARASTTTRFTQCVLRWFDASNAFLSDSIGTAVSATNSAWVHATSSAAAPANAASVSLVVEFTGTVSTEIFYSDDHAVRLNAFPYSQDYAVNITAGKTLTAAFCDLAGAIGASTGAGTLTTLTVP